MEYGDMYTLLDSETVHGEGGYVLKQQRKKRVFFKFGVQRHKLLYKGGKRFFRCHIAANESRIPILKITNRLGCIPDHWISRVTIDLRFFRSSVFVHHPIKASDHGTFPLTLFGRDNV
jgi:hypothetical protein